MKSLFSLSIYILLLLKSEAAFPQQIRFNLVVDNTTSRDPVTSIAQDRQGFIWYTTNHGGLHQYDGSQVKSYRNDPNNANSLADNRAACLIIDTANIIWVGTSGSGLDRFDPEKNTFTHFRHNKEDGSGLSNDTVTAVLEDREGNLWIGTFGGLDLLDRKTGKFTHYTSTPNEASSLSYRQVYVLYEDRNGTLWVGCGSTFSEDNQKPEDGGLNSFNRSTGKFTRYLHDPNKPNSLENNKVQSIFEDSKGNFWIGTAGDGLHIMDRAKGIFAHYYYDPAHPEKLSRPPLYQSKQTGEVDYITFITEDATGGIWIGTYLEGINHYDPGIQKITHYGVIGYDNYISFNDTISGFNKRSCWQAFSSKDGLLWICAGDLYNINPLKPIIPYYNIHLSANSFYEEPGGNVLWIATNKGLVRKDLNSKNEKTWVHDPKNANSLSYDEISNIKVDEDGKFWLGTLGGGLDKFDPQTGIFTRYIHDHKKPGSLGSDTIHNLFIDHANNLWIAEISGLDKMDISTGSFINYRNDKTKINSISDDYVYCIAEDHDNKIWIGTVRGINRLDNKTGEFHHYLPSSNIRSICVDAKGIVWVGAVDGLYYFDVATDQFLLYTDQDSLAGIKGIIHILEDDKKNLWVNTFASIIKVNATRSAIKIYGESYGVKFNQFKWGDNFKGKNGELFLGDFTGYYAFFPDQLKDNTTPLVNFTAFNLHGKEIKFAPGGILSAPIWQVKEIKLNYDENVFSFDFAAIHYNSPGEEKYLFMLENYDNNWHSLGADHKAYFFNVPPGSYIFHARAVNSDGISGEKDIRIIITPPWWHSWWAYAIFILLFVSAVWGFIYYRSRKLRHENRVLEKKVERRTHELQQEKEKVESTLSELKSTQTQLIQSEKMASLGELIAGIAHEIQNPLNFVNNFSDLNKELLVEMKDEIDKGNVDEVKAIASNVIENEVKINHHGHRADAIVKGMLQHSRGSIGQKKPTEINALAEEYLRLSYHGLRTKDTSFNATRQTDFDEGIDRINIVPQDIGRVLLNLYNNAFYAVNEKKKQQPQNYEPTVSVTTKKIKGKIQINVKDNGTGMPQKVSDKIFQPFFTTKPAGQGTGLGLSLSYDIIKAHGGEIKVNTKEGEGAEFIIQLPGE